MRWGVLVLLAGCGAEPVHTVTHHLDTSGGTALELMGVDGSASIMGWGENALVADVAIVAPEDARTPEADAAAIEGLETDLVAVFGGLDVLHAQLPDDLPEGYAVDLSVRVPYDAFVIVNAVHGDIAVSDVQQLDLVDEDGHIDIRHINGQVRVSDQGGGIRIVDIQGSVDVDDASGDLVVRNVTGDVSVTGASDDLRLVNVGGEILLD